MANEDQRGFLLYRSKMLAKVNGVRAAVSQPGSFVVPPMQPDFVGFTEAASMHNEPASCANCVFHRGSWCALIGAGTIVRKFIYPPEAEPSIKRIEYWPCCSKHTYGAPGKEQHLTAQCSPDELGLVWINAPRIGLPISGANCCGVNGGDDCDFAMTEEPDKSKVRQAFCRVLQRKVNAADVCAAWHDDDQVSWREAQVLMTRKGSAQQEHGKEAAKAIATEA